MKTARCCNTGRNCLILRFLNLRHIFPKMSDSQPVFFLPNLATHCCHANLFFFFSPSENVISVPVSMGKH